MTLFIHRNAGGRCPCGAENATCGPPSDVVPVDQLIEEVPAVSGPLKKYRVTRGGVQTVMKLSDDDAARLGVGSEDAIDAVSTIPTVEPVADSEADSSGEGDDGSGPDGGAADDDGQAETPPAAMKTAAKRRTTSSNKARSASATKAADGGS